VEIINENGSIEARRASGSKVTIKAFREVSDSSDDKAQARLQSLKMREDVDADHVSVQAETGESSPFGMRRGISVRYEVELPPGLSVTLRTQNGTVRLDRLDGQITAASTNGIVTGQSVSGSVQGSTVNGSVQMDIVALTGDVRLSTVNGTVRLELPKDLDADIEDLARFALPRAEELEIADEAPDRRRGKALGPRLVTDLILERRHVGDEVRLALLVDGVDGEPTGRSGQQVVAPVGIAARLADLDERTHAGQREGPALAHLAALADQHDPERCAGVQAVPGQSPVAVLEDVQREDDPRAEDRVQREERDLQRPSSRFVGRLHAVLGRV